MFVFLHIIGFPHFQLPNSGLQVRRETPMHNVNRASCTRTSQILYAEEEAGGRGRMQMQDAEAEGRGRQKVEVQGEGSRQSNSIRLSTFPPDLRSREGYPQNEVPGHIGAYTQTHPHLLRAIPVRARRRRISETPTRTYVAPKS